MPDEVFELTIPSKVFDYMSVGRPILFGILGEGRDILRSTGGNIEFKPSDPYSFKAALISLHERHEALEWRARTNPDVVRRMYSREHNTDVLLDVFEQVQAVYR